MKKRFVYILLSTLVAVFLFLTGGVFSKKKRAEQVAERIEILPVFSLPTLKGDVFDSEKITAGPILITYFHPECEHCQYEISSLSSRKLSKDDLKVILVSQADPYQTEAFVRKFDFKNDSLLWILCDTSNVFSRIFNIEKIPSNYIYDKNRHLIRIFKGETDVEVIIKSLK